MAVPKIVLIAAVAENGVIGRDGGMPWRLSSDLKRFKADTLGKPIIMGRRTFDSLGRALPGRTNIVVTRNPSFDAEGCLVFNSLTDAFNASFEEARALGAGDICVIGGGQIYKDAFSQADRLLITHVNAALDGDTVFPEIKPDEWQVVEAMDFPAGEKDDYPTRYVVYERKTR